jgi:hypothetical protein
MICLIYHQKNQNEKKTLTKIIIKIESITRAHHDIIHHDTQSLKINIETLKNSNSPRKTQTFK